MTNKTSADLAISSVSGIARKKKRVLPSSIKNNLDIYLLIAFPLLVLLVYNYIPMLGVIIAFKDYKVFDGILASKWIGLEHFQTLLADPKFYSVLRNTILINLYKFIFQFPLPILLALLLNEMRKGFVKKTVQTLTYIPHFLSWVVIAGIFVDLLSPSTGFVNAIIKSFGFQPITFLGDERFFRSIMVVSSAWKETGWNAVIYLAALTAIDPELYSAASVDGAGKLRQIWNVTLPGISSTIVFVVILRVANVIAINGSDTEQVLLFYNPLVYSVGDTLGTYVFREGIQNASYSYTTAVGLFVSVISCTLMIFANKFSKKYSSRGVW